MENMLALIMQFGLILTFGMFWYIVLRWTAEESICLSILSIMTIVFISGYFGVAQTGILLIYVFSFLGFFLFVFGKKLRIASGEYKHSFFSPGIILLFLVFVYGIVAFSGLCIYNWDELHQWGKAVNFMLHNNSLPMGDGFDGEEVLLSSTTLFHYFFCKLPKVFSGEIVESNMYVSNLILWFSAVILPLSGTKWKSWKACVGYALTIFLSMNILFVQPYYNIYCDQPVTMWAGALIAWNLFCKERKYREVFIVLSLLHISFMKNMMGPLFAIIVIMAVFIKYILHFQGNLKEIVGRLLKSISLSKFLFAILSVGSVFFLTVFWSWRISENALVRGDGIVKTQDDRLVLTLKSGLAKWFQPVNLSSSFPNLTFFVFLCITIVLVYIISRKYLIEKIKKQYVVLISFYVVGFFAFFAVMIYAYLTTFSYADSIVTGSLNRYFSDYMMLGMIPLVVPVFLLRIPKDNMRINALGVVILLLCVFSTTNGFASKSSSISVTSSSTYKERVKMREYRENAISLMSDDKKIYMINQNTDGYFTVAADYVFEHLLDRTGMCYYFTREDKEIAGLSHMNIRALPEVLLLEDYGYLWIYRTDAYFNENAFDVLKIKTPQNGDFYKVINSNGRLKLQYLGNIQDSEDGDE